MKLAEYLAQDGLGLAELVRRREVKGAEVLACAAQMLERVNPGINAVVETYAEPLAGSDDPAAPFHGVPFVVKDLVLHAAGHKIEMGSRLAKGLVLPHDTDLMTRFRKAGLRTIGRATSPEFGYCPTTENVLHGPTRNPWDTNRSPGGSSGGSGAAVSSGIVPLAHASDGGGSIRIPAACNGLVGLKPTRARTPIGPDAAEGLNGLGIEFAVTRTVRDSAALLDAVHGPGLGDPYVAPTPVGTYADALRRQAKPLRIAVMEHAWGGARTEAEVLAGLRNVARECTALGHSVTEAAPKIDWDAFVATTMVFWTANLATWIDEMAGASGRPIDGSTLEATTLACYRYGQTLKAKDLLHAMGYHNGVRRTVAAFFESYDVLLTPTLPTPPAMLGTINANDPSLDAEGWTRKVFTYTPFTPVFNTTGQPAVSLPLARTAAGVPLGMQFVGRFGAEDVLLNLAAQFEQAMPWPRVSPLALAAAG
jgi:amidase